jgi:hypothetical protein
MTNTQFATIPASAVEKVVHDTKNRVLHGVCTSETKDIFPLTKEGGSALVAPSVNAVLRHIAEHMPEAKQQKASSKHADSDDGFYTFKTYEEAFDTFSNRPYELAVFKEASDMIKVMDAPGIEIDFDVVGDDLDMGRFLEGDPLCYSHMVMGNARSVVANLYVSTSAPYWVSKDAFARKVARICRLCDWLETNRVRTRIVALEANQMGIMEVVVKDFADPMYLPNVAVVAHGDFLRRIIFRVNEYSKTWSSGYGTAINLSSDGHSKIAPAYGEITIVIDQGTDADKVDKSFDHAELKIAEIIPDINAGKFNASATWPVIKIKGYNSDDEPF